MNLTFFDELLHKEMDRREFLLSLGLFVLALTGITGLLRRLRDAAPGRPVAQGFGAGVYGGTKPTH